MKKTLKIVFILAFGFIYSNEVKAQIYFPEDLLVDPLSSDIKELKIKKIEQYSVWTNDSSRFNLNYVLIFDSSFHLKTMFYNGQRRGDSYFYLDSDVLDDSHRNSTFESDSFNIYAFNIKNRINNLKFFRLDYTFENDKFIKVEEIEPKAYSGPINVADISSFNSESTNFKSYFEQNKLVKTEFFKNDTLIYTRLFEYSKLVENSKIQLLTKVIWQNRNMETEETYIKYYF